MPVSQLAKIGVTQEASWGAGGSPTLVFPADSWSVMDPYEPVLDNAMRGVIAKDFQAFQGVGRSEASLEGPVFPELFGHLLKPLFGNLSSGTVSPYVHTFTFSGSPPSIAIVEDNTVRQHQARGLMVSELSLNFSPTEGMLSYSASMTGKNMATVSYTFPTELHLTKPMFLGWHGSASLDGATFPMIEGDISIAREVQLWYQMQGTQFAGTAYASAPEITGSFTIDWTAGADYDRYINNTMGSVDLWWRIGTVQSLKIEMGSVFFGDGPVELDKSAAAVTLGYSYRALYASALSGPARAILTNLTASY